METTVSAGKVYFLRENITGKENDECTFRFEQGKEDIRFYFEVRDADIISPYTADNEDIFDGDAVEVFIAPQGDRTHYYEIEVSPFGKRFWARVENRTGRRISRIEKSAPAYTAQAERTPEGYRVVIDVPFASLEGFDADRYLFNAFRLDKKANGRQLLYALSPTRCKKFHRPRFFIGEKKA